MYALALEKHINILIVCEMKIEASTQEDGKSSCLAAPPCSSSERNPVAKVPHLIPLLDIESSDDAILSEKNKNLFFVESSDRNYLRAREACSIESAIRNSDLKGHFVIAMTAQSLDINGSNATCHIYNNFEGHKVIFRHVNVDTIFQGTPLQQLHQSGKLRMGKQREQIVQYRLVVNS